MNKGAKSALETKIGVPITSRRLLNKEKGGRAATPIKRIPYQKSSNLTPSSGAIDSSIGHLRSFERPASTVLLCKSSDLHEEAVN